MMGNGPESWARVRRGKVQARWEFRMLEGAMPK